MSLFYENLPPSFGSQVFSGNASLGSYDFKSTFDSKPSFGVDTEGKFNSVAEALSGQGALGNGGKGGWTFITAPEDVSWDVANQANRVDMFGTNNPPVVAGTRGMRDLTLGNSLVEGFVRGVTVEGKIAALEDLMNYKLNQTDGFVSVPVYQVWANEKAYGDGYYIIKDIRIKETMRDLKGDATRASVDISFMEVPEYQVNTGRDQASQTTAGAQALALPQSAGGGAAGNKASQAAANKQIDNNLNKGNNSGPTAPTSTPAGTAPAGGQYALPGEAPRIRRPPPRGNGQP